MDLSSASAGWTAPDFSVALASAPRLAHANPEVQATVDRFRSDLGSMAPRLSGPWELGKARTDAFVRGLAPDPGRPAVDLSGPSAWEYAKSMGSGFYEGARQATDRLINNMTAGYVQKAGIVDVTSHQGEAMWIEKPLAWVASGALLTAAALATGGSILTPLAEGAYGTAAVTTIAAGAGVATAKSRIDDADQVHAMGKFQAGAPLSEKEFLFARDAARGQLVTGWERVASAAAGTAKDAAFAALPGAGTVAAGIDDYLESGMAGSKLAHMRAALGAGNPVSWWEDSALAAAAGSSILTRSGEKFLRAGANYVSPGVARAMTSAAADYGVAVLGGAAQNYVAANLGGREEWVAYLAKLADAYPEYDKAARLKEASEAARLEERIKIAREKERRVRGL